MKKLISFFAILFCIANVNAQTFFYDSTFNSVGYNMDGYLNNEYLSQVDITPDSSVIVSGDGGDAFANQTFHILAKYKCNGKLDSTFGTNGISRTHWDFYSTVYASAVQPDGKILLAGDMTVSNGGGDPRCSITRYNTDGSVDTSFNHTGNRAEKFDGTNPDFFFKIFVLPNGKIVCTGCGNFSFQAIRLNSDGSLDNTFGNYSPGRTRIGGNYGSTGDAFMAADGKITMLQHVYSSNIIALCRIKTDGTADSTFGNVSPGIYQTDNTTGWLYSDKRSKIYQTNNNQMIITGTVNDVDYLVYRLNANGATDSTFGVNGVETFTPLPGSGFNFGNHVSGRILPTGKILMWGTGSDAGGTTHALIIRLNNDGTIDSTFATEGMLINHVSTFGSLYCANELPDSRLICPYNSWVNNITNTYIYKFTKQSYMVLPQLVQNGSQLVFNFTASAQLVWLLNGIPIAGATGTTYTPVVNGSYSVEVVQFGGCSDLSNTVSVTDIPNGISEINKDEINIYPNPTTYIFTITGLTNFNTIKIFDAVGRNVYTQINKNQKNISVDISSFSDGIYSVNILNEDGSNNNFKIVKIKQ